MVQNPEVSWTHKNGWRSCSDSTVPWQLANFPEFSGQLHISKRSVCHSGNGLKIVEVKNYHPQLSMKREITEKTTIQNTLSFRCNRITYNLCLWVSPYLTLQNITHKTFQHPKHPVIAPPRFVSLSYLTLEDNNEITAKAPKIAVPKFFEGPSRMMASSKDTKQCTYEVSQQVFRIFQTESQLPDE